MNPTMLRLLAFLLLLGAPSLAGDATPAPRRASRAATHRLFSTTQFVGLQATHDGHGMRLTAAISPTPSAFSRTVAKAGRYTLTTGPAAFTPAATTAAAAVSGWALY